MPQSLEIQLHNDSSSQIYAYVTGISLLPSHQGQRVLVKSNGRDLYFPSSPAEIMSPLTEDVAIPLGPPGSKKSIHIPQMAGGRIWFARDAKLTFLLNPGPSLVEPSVLNPADPNAKVDFAFAEFTLNNDQLFANISYVDFVPRLPVALTLQTATGAVQHVSGMPANGLDKLCSALRAQAQKDHRPWDKLIVPGPSPNQPPLRCLNPTHGDAVGASFAGYYEPYVEEVWRQYHAQIGKRQIHINTQAAPGIVSGSVNPANNTLVVAGEAFAKPTTADILGCNSGPFTTGPSAKRNAIIPRLAAGFLRSTIGEVADQPSGCETYYRRDPTNHYARAVHEVNLDGKGYAFAYDDVQPDGGKDQSGKVNAGDPKVWVVSVGGEHAYVGDRMP
ncbi:glucanase B [Coniochaeta sp. 2T2.1]|nr:glucanase B [Coniochaeta sp. 2T2.1]